MFSRGIILGGKAILLFIVAASLGLAQANAAGDAERGQRVFRQCAACHSLEPRRHLTGPSLARIWKRKAGTIEGFPQYSDALKKSGIVWDERTLDRWLKESQAMVPGNLMTFPDIRKGQVRADLIAYLKDVSSGRRVAETPRRGGMMGGSMLNLKELGKDHRVRAIQYCGNSYYVTSELGMTLSYWEFNLRFKTASSPDGPPKGTPVLIRASMREGSRLRYFFLT